MIPSQGDATLVGEPSLVAVLQAYQQAVAAGRRPDRDDLLRRFPKLAPELKAFWASEDDRDGPPTAVIDTPLSSWEDDLPTLTQPDPDQPRDAAEDDGPDSEGGSKISLPNLSQQFGDYELLHEIARGGMGVVYKARHAHLNRVVALKMILAGQFASAFDLQRFRTEAAAAANLDHPNIVPIYEVGEYQGRHYFSMKLIEGGSLAQRSAELHESGSWVRPSLWAKDQRAVARLIATVARAVHYAHEHGILHRDLKPANILLDRDGQPHVTDFGLAKRVEATQGMTDTGTLVGTPGYMAPEQASSRKGTTTAVDVYSLGAILFELLTGRPPFKAETALETLLQVVEHEPPRPRSFNARVDRELETICLRCLEKEPAKRYRSAEALADDLDRWLNGEPIQARAVSTSGRIWRWCRRNPVSAGFCVAIIGFALTGSLGTSLYITNQRIQAAYRDAVMARDAAELSEAKAKKAQEEATRQRAEAVKQQALAEKERAEQALNRRKRETELALTRGKELCERGDTARGLLWLAHSLKLAPPDADDQRRACWANLAGWYTQVHSIRHCLEHPSEITALRYDPDGKTLYTGCRDGKLHQWDAETGLLRWSSAKADAHAQPVRAIVLSPDGQTLLSGSGDDWLYTKGGGEARLWAAATGKPRGRIDRAAPVWSVAFRPDGKTFATSCLDRRVYVWDTATLAQAGDPLPHDRPVTLVTYSPDGTTIVTACAHNYEGNYEDYAYLWDTATGKQRGVALPHHGGIRALAFSPDGQSVLTGGTDGKARLWDWAGGKLRLPATLNHVGGDIVAVGFSPDGRTLLTGGKDYKVRLWDAATGAAIGQPVLHPSEVKAVAAGPDGHSFATAEGSVVRIWDLASTRLRAARPLLDLPETVRAMTFGRGGRTLLLRHGDTLRLWDPATGRGVGPRIPDPGGADGALAVGPDNEVIAAGGPDGKVWLYNGVTGQRLAPVLNHGKRVLAVAFSPDGRKLLTGGEDFVVRYWSTATGAALGPPQPLDHNVTAVAISPDGDYALTGTAGGQTWLWKLNAAGLRPIGAPLENHGAVEAVAFSADGKRFAVAQWGDIAVRVYEFLTREEARKKRGPSDAAASKQTEAHNARKPQSKTPDGDDEGPRDTRKPENGLKPLGLPMEHPNRVRTLVFSPDGRLLMTGCDDGQARLWSAESGERVGPPVACRSPVRAVAFARGKTALAAELDKAIRGWDLPDLPTGEAERVVLWVNVLTGLKLDQYQSLQVLSTADWVKGRQQLGQQGAPPGQLEQPGQLANWHRHEAAACEASRQWLAACWHLDRLLLAEPNDLPLHARRGRARAELSRWHDAAQDFDRAIALNHPSSTAYWDEYALTLLAAGDLEDYRRFCGGLLTKHAAAADDRILAEKAVAICRLGLRELSDVTPVLQMAARNVANAPKAARLYTTYAAVLNRAGRPKEALEHLAIAEKLRGSTVSAYDQYILAMTYHYLGNSAEAKRRLEQAVRLSEKEADGEAVPWSTRLEWQRLRREVEMVVLSVK